MWKNLPFKGFVYVSLVASLGSAATILALRRFLPPVVPFLYGLPSGEDQLITSLGLLIAPAAGLVITCLNVFLTTFTKDQFFKKTLIVSSTFVSVLVAITVIKIILLVGFF